MCVCVRVCVCGCVCESVCACLCARWACVFVFERMRVCARLFLPNFIKFMGFLRQFPLYFNVLLCSCARTHSCRYNRHHSATYHTASHYSTIHHQAIDYTRTHYTTFIHISAAGHHAEAHHTSIYHTACHHSDHGHIACADYCFCHCCALHVHRSTHQYAC